MEKSGITKTELILNPIFEEAPDPIILFEKGRCVACNRATIKILGVKGKEALMSSGLPAISPNEQPDGVPSIEKAKKMLKEIPPEEERRFSWLCINEKGDPLWFDVTVSAVPLEERQILCTFWRDVSEQRMIEEKLKESEEKFKVFSLSGQDAVLVMDTEGVIEDINRAAEKILGYRREDVLGKTIQEYLSPGSFYEAQRLQLAITEAMPYTTSTRQDGATGKVLEFSATAQDGAEVRLELSLFSEAVGAKWRILGIFHDVTERHETLNALKKSEEKYRRLFEETKDVVFLCSPGGYFIEINKAGFTLFGFESKEEVLKTSLATDLCVDPNDWRQFSQVIEQTGFVKMHQMSMKSKDGRELVVSATANAVYDQVGNVVVYQGIIRDLTKRKRLEQELFEYQKLDAVGKMIGDITHNFNNILNIIIGEAQLAKMTGQCSEEVTGHLSSIEDEVFRAADIVEHLLVFGRRKQLDMRVVDLNDVVRDFFRIAGEVIGSGIETKMTFSIEALKVRADSGRIHQILFNLATNACEAMAGKGTLTVELRKERITEAQRALHKEAKAADYALLTVSDTGSGVADEVMKKIFEPFFTTNRKGGKKGLGLSVVYGIMKEHEGFVEVATKKDTGTTFLIYLPLAEEIAPAQTTSKTSIEGAGESILIAEDEPALRDIAAAILRTLGYSVLLASDGKEALDIVKEKYNDIDLVLLDVAMPILNGREAYREIRKIRADLPVLFATGYSLDGLQTSFIPQEGYEAIQKPYTLTALGRKIREVLGKEKKKKQKDIP